MISHKVFWTSGKDGLVESKEITTYANCPVQSLRFVLDGVKYCSGIAMPGRYDFGTAKVDEDITIEFGKIDINGIVYGSGQTVEIKKGDPHVWTVKSTAIYLCKLLND